MAQTPTQARRTLIRMVRTEHASERGAALAYQCHAASVAEPHRTAIARIEQEEWHHRAELARLLTVLGASISPWQEAMFYVFGSTLGRLCYVSGWLLPMLGASFLEGINTRGYARMAECARICGLSDEIETLAALGDVEGEHEAYFRARAREHWLGRWLPLWPAPPRRVIEPS